MSNKTERIKLNNSGFSLLEVLIAMVILCLVSIPLLHSFVTTARTNSRAKIMMRATDCAENIMESIEYRSVESGQHILRIRHFTKLLLEEVARSCPEYGLTPEIIDGL